MSHCDYIYISGLRVKSGDATVALNGEELRVVRGGNGKNPAGTISIKQLKAALAEWGSTTIEATVLLDSGAKGKFSATLDPSSAVGRKGRERDASATLAKMPPAEAAAAAVHQIRTLPYSLKAGRHDAKRRLDAVVSLLDRPGLRSAATVDAFWELVDLEGLDWLVAEHPAAALTRAADRMSDAQINEAFVLEPGVAMRYALHRLSDAQKLQAVIQNPEHSWYLAGEIANPNASELVEELRRLRAASEATAAALSREWDRRSVTNAQLQEERALFDEQVRRAREAAREAQALREARIAAQAGLSTPE
jgi:hypothetical protein